MEKHFTMKSIAVQLAPGFEEIEAITIIDVLRRANLDVTTISMTDNLTVVGSHNIPIIADKLFDEVDYSEMDMLILPGGIPGASHLDNHSGLRDQILDFNKHNKMLGAICAAPLVFGHLNLLNGKQAVCYPGLEKELKGAIISKEPTVLSDNIITGRGVGATLQFSLKIVETLVSKEKANSLAEAMLVE